MAYDPVLDREMFRPRSRGVEELRDTEESDSVKARREQALAMIEAAKQKFDPANYQTLTEQDRPGVFRPVAVNIPAQQQTADTAMRMQQMAAQGVRPVSMARGGSVAHFADGGYNPYAGIDDIEDRLSINERSSLNKMMASPPVRPTIDSENYDRLPKDRERAPYDPYQLEGGAPAGMTYNLADDPTTWTPDFKEAMIDKIYAERIKERGKVDPRFRTYVEDPTPEKIAREIDKKAAEIRVSRRQTWANEDAARRSEAAPDKRDFGQEREYTANVLADQTAREQAAPDKRDYAGEREYASGIERILADKTAREQAAPDKRDYAGEREFNASNLRALEDAALREQAAPDKRDYASEREARGLAALRDSVRTGDQPGAIADASRPASGIRSGEEKAAAPDTSRGGAPATGAPATGGAPAAGGVGSFKAAGESVDSGPMTLEGIRAERAREREENINLGLIQAGLAIMGGKSSNALANIGEGAQAGIRQFATQEAESKKNMRDVMRDIRQERLTRDEMALRERLSANQIKATSDLAAAQRASTEAMFGRTENRLDRTQQLEFDKTEAAQKLARDQHNLNVRALDARISAEDKDREQKILILERQLAQDTWKVQQGIAAPSETMKLYTALGDGDLKKGFEKIKNTPSDTMKLYEALGNGDLIKGYSIYQNAPSDTMKLYEKLGGGDMMKGYKAVQDASTMDSRVRAAQDILNPMSGASDDERKRAISYLSSIIKTSGASGTVDTGNPLLR